MIETDLFAWLSTQASIKTAAVGGVYAVLAPENVLTPYLCFTKITENRASSLCYTDNIQRDWMQFDSYDKSMAGAAALAAVLRAAMIDFKGLMGATRVNRVLFENESHMLDPEPGLFRVMTTLLVWHANAVA